MSLEAGVALQRFALVAAVLAVVALHPRPASA